MGTLCHCFLVFRSTTCLGWGQLRSSGMRLPARDSKNVQFQNHTYYRNRFLNWFLKSPQNVDAVILAFIQAIVSSCEDGRKFSMQTLQHYS